MKHLFQIACFSFCCLGIAEEPMVEADEKDAEEISECSTKLNQVSKKLEHYMERVKELNEESE